MAKGMLKYADNTEKGPSMTGRGEAGKTPLPCKYTGLVTLPGWNQLYRTENTQECVESLGQAAC